MPVRAVLWDADGVLQRLPGFDQLWRFLDEETRLRLLADVFADMPEVLSGRVDMDRRLTDVLGRHELASEDVVAVRATWSDLPPVEEARVVLTDLRQRGITCVLATNQDNLRAEQMRPIYAPLMDRCYFSCDLGDAKPSVAFFEHILDDLGVSAEEALFIDDSEDNIVGARAAGLNAECWHHDDGIGELQRILAAHGL